MTEQNRLPRLDLHCHLDGSLSQGCIEELLGRSVKPEELQADMDCQSLAEYLEKFEIPLECLQTEKGLERAGYDFMKNAALDHVSYIEARFAPLFSRQRGLSTEQVIESVLRGMEQGKKEFDIDYGVIGFDTAMFLSQPGESTSQNIAEFCNEWGIDSSLQQAGGLSPQGMQIPRSPRQIVMLQRKASKPGQGLGKTTSWIHRTTLLSRGVKMTPGVSYQKIDDDGLHVVINGEPQVLAVDNVVICAGQEPNRALAQPLIDSGKTVHLIGGCDVAMELDARRAIAQGTRLALEI